MVLKIEFQSGTESVGHSALDAVGSWQMILPMPNLDKESEAVLQCLQYEQCAGPQKQEVINDRSSIIFW